MKIKRTEQTSGNEISAIPSVTSSIESSLDSVLRTVKTFLAKHRTAVSSIAIACALSAVAVQSTDACGPFSKIAVFVTSNHPDFPMKRYAAGELGVLNRGYARSFLVVAYRYLAGIKNSPSDQKEFVVLWERRLEALDVSVQEAMKEWAAERKKVLSTKEKAVDAYDTNMYLGYLTYNADAFKTATKTLRSKIEKYGADDSRVKEWLKAQDQIFGISSNNDSNSTASSGAQKTSPTETVAAGGDNEADTKYQKACEDFYAGRYDAAVEKFQAIAADKSSPWQRWGDYLAARAYCRKATMGDAVIAADLRKAKELITKIINDKDNADMHVTAKRLESFVDFRLDPSARAKQVVAALTTAGSTEDLTEALGDYTLILDKVIEKPTTNSPTSMRLDSPGIDPDAPGGDSDSSATRCDALSMRFNHSGTGNGGTDSLLLGYAALSTLVFLSGHRLWWRRRTDSTLTTNSTIALALTVSLLSSGLSACTQGEKQLKTDTNTQTHVMAQATGAADAKLPSASDVILDDDMTKWILNFQDSKAESLNVAYENWKKSNSLPWLVSVMSKIGETDQRKPEVVAAAAKVSADSPAYVTLEYHQIRLLIGENKPKEAATRLSELLSKMGSKLPPSTRNSLFEMGVSCAGSLAEFVKLAAPSPAVITWDYDINELPDTDASFEPGPVKLTATDKYFDYTGCLTDQSAEIVNKAAPLSTYVALATSNTLPATVRLDLAQAGWTRSVLLKNEKMAMTLSPVLSKLRPQLSKSLATYDAAKSGSEKDYAALSTILRNPGMRPYVTAGLPRETAFDKIDSFRNNWWSSTMPQAPRNMYRDDEEEEGKKKEAPKEVSSAFLTPAELAQGRKESADITKLGTAPNDLAQRVLALAKANPKDPRLAEMLHLVVTTTRYGNTDDKTTVFSKQAYQALHKNFPTNEWAKKTKFWF